MRRILNGVSSQMKKLKQRQRDISMMLYTTDPCDMILMESIKEQFYMHGNGKIALRGMIFCKFYHGFIYL